MMMKISLNQILTYLETNSIEHVVKGEIDTKDDFALASLKNIVPFGVYYLEKEYIDFSQKLNQSIIITNSKEENVLLKNNLYIFVDNPQIIFYHLSRLVLPAPKVGIHPTAIINENAIIGSECYIGHYSVIGEATIGNNCFIDSHVIIGDNVSIGNNVRIEPNSYISANGVAWIWDDEGNRVIQPQYGGVIIEDNCFIGSDVTIVKGSVNEYTKIGKGTLIAHGSKIGHGSQLAENCHLANNVSLAGNSQVGARTFLGSACVLSSHVKISEDSIVGAGAVVTKSFNEKEIILGGVPAKILKKIEGNKKLNGIPKRK